MVKVRELEAAKFEILLKPNSSLTGAARILFLGSIFFICSVIGIGFFIAGGVMILPFAGLEIISVSYTHLRAHETPEHRGWRGGG